MKWVFAIGLLASLALADTAQAGALLRARLRRQADVVIINEVAPVRVLQRERVFIERPRVIIEDRPRVFFVPGRGWVTGY